MRINKLIVTSSVSATLALTIMSSASASTARINCDGSVQSDGSCVILAQAPTNAPLPPAPTVTPAHKPGYYIKACVLSYAKGGRKQFIEYGKRTLPNPDGRFSVRAGHCRVVELTVPRHKIFEISYDKYGRATGSSYVHHIGLG